MSAEFAAILQLRAERDHRGSHSAYGRSIHGRVSMLLRLRRLDALQNLPLDMDQS